MSWPQACWSRWEEKWKVCLHIVEAIVEWISGWICKTVWKPIPSTWQAVLLYIIYIHPTVQLPYLPTLPLLLWTYTLGIEETSHPKYIGPPLKYPSRKLGISFQKFCKPEAQCGWIPGHSFPDMRYASIIHVVQGISQILKKCKVKIKE